MSSLPWPAHCPSVPPAAWLAALPPSTAIDCYMAAALAKKQAWLPLSPWAGATSKRVPLFRLWHVETQQRLFTQLRRVWDDDRPRVMVDLGCHAGHGTWKMHTTSRTAARGQRFFAPGIQATSQDTYGMRSVARAKGARG